MNKMKKNLQSNILLLPALIAGFFCYLFPILIAFWKSLFLGTGSDFVGIQNYVALFENEALDRKSTRLNSSHTQKSRMPSSA